MPTLEAIKYARGSLQLLDQRLLPTKEVYLDVRTCEDAHKLIKDMAVRGAPAIAVAGILGLAVDLHSKGSGSNYASVSEAADDIKEKLVYLVTSRPTAVNLLDASRKLHTLIDTQAADPSATPASLTAAVINYAECMPAVDVISNRTLAAHGMKAMISAAEAAGRGVGGKLRVLTHCNTGSLATVQYGTALGCIRALWESGKLEHAFCTETRPYNQGARLTAYELVVEAIPATLIADSAAAALMAAGRVDAVVVGADRVAANGDTANKVGTCMLSVAAAAFGVPFFIAAPTTSIDAAIPNGAGIEIEERGAGELTHSTSHKDVRVVADGIGVWNPAFDVAMAANITGIATEKGMVPKVNGAFDIPAFFAANGVPVPPGVAPAPEPCSVPNPLATPPGFHVLTLDNVAVYAAGVSGLATRIGPLESAGDWKAAEIGDGNINYIFLVQGPAGAVILKQGLPYVRCVGESWPLSQDRLRYEAESLREMHRHCPQHIPEVFAFDGAMCVIAMQYLPPPHVVLRYGILSGAQYPQMAEMAAEQMATCLFHTSMLKLSSEAFRAQADKFSNPAMCGLTEQVIFTDPYYNAPHNHHTSPQLDALAQSLYTDSACKVAALEAKAKFCQNRQALIHGDLHTGSCMVTKDSYYVIDSEFAFYGPIAFDIGKFIANLLLTFFALDGHSTDENDRAGQRAYILQAARDVWNRFSGKFTRLWNEEAGGSGLVDGNVYSAVDDAPSHAAAQTAFMRSTFSDALLFAGCVMIRRLVGIAHNADFSRIEDGDVRAVCEERALMLGRELLVHRGDFVSIEEVVAAATHCRDDGRSPCYPVMLSETTMEED